MAHAVAAFPYLFPNHHEPPFNAPAVRLQAKPSHGGVVIEGLPLLHALGRSSKKPESARSQRIIWRGTGLSEVLDSTPCCLKSQEDSTTRNFGIQIESMVRGMGDLPAPWSEPLT